MPAHVDAQRVLHLVDARSRETRAALDGSGIRGDAVDIVRLEARVGDGFERCIAREIKVITEQPPPDGRLADAGNDRPTLRQLSHCDHLLSRLHCTLYDSVSSCFFRLEERQRDVIADVLEHYTQ